MNFDSTSKLLIAALLSSLLLSCSGEGSSNSRGSGDNDSATTETGDIGNVSKDKGEIIVDEGGSNTGTVGEINLD